MPVIPCPKCSAALSLPENPEGAFVCPQCRHVVPIHRPKRLPGPTRKTGLDRYRQWCGPVSADCQMIAAASLALGVIGVTYEIFHDHLLTDPDGAAALAKLAGVSALFILFVIVPLAVVAFFTCRWGKKPGDL